ncbi:uncharacterized protein PG998_013788 [Apiospora kogelbergensis]|uniref:Uncharacterized protein n=1 Tax=Apiospora kogelbergensis TaxID=1337665 RepID=A0AAW0R0E2_9PEZI
MTADGGWYREGGAPSISVIKYEEEEHRPGDIADLTNRDWCYHAECDMVIFANLVGDVVFQENDDARKNNKRIKKKLDDVGNWPKVLEEMEAAGWAFTMGELQAHWKEAVVPKLHAIRETRARRNLKDLNGIKYNAAAGLAAACHRRNVDPADHPHGFKKPMPLASAVYLERVCQELGGKSAEVIREQEQALKLGRQLKKAKREGVFDE